MVAETLVVFILKKVDVNTLNRKTATANRVIELIGKKNIT